MKKLIIILAFATASLSASAESWFNASLTPDIAVQSRDTQINGLTLSIWGENPQSSLALGFVNGSTGASKGAQFGLFNYSETFTGVQFGVVNWSKSGDGLVQLGFANIIEDNGWFENLPEKFATGFVFVNWGF